MDRVIDSSGKKKRRIAYYVLGVILVVGFALFALNGFGTHRLNVEEDKITIAEVEKGLFKEYIPVSGTVQPIQTVFLDAVEGGSVEEIFAEDGKMIEKGSPIIRLANQQLHMDAINREAQLLDQQNNLRNTRLSMEQQTIRLKEELLQLDYQMNQIRRTAEVQKKLFAENLISKNEYDKSQEEYQYMQSKRKLLTQNIKNDSLFRIDQVSQIESSLELIHKNLQFLQSSLENLIILAPISGQLTSLRAELGETKSKGENIAQIDIITDYKIRARIGEHYVSRIFAGLRGNFEFNNKKYQIVVQKIYPEVNNGEFEVDLFFEGEKPEGIKRGQSLQIKLELSEEMQAIMVPRGSYYQDTGGGWIYVVEGDKAIKREVKLGRQNPDYYEVIEGLRPGEKVITSRYSAFNEADELIINRKK